MRTMLKRVEELKPGHLVTEGTTPEGPFYKVLKVNAKSYVVDAAYEDEDPEPLPVRVPFTAGYLVRVQI